MAPIINHQKCTKCGICAEHCPQDVYNFEKGNIPDVAYPYECYHCAACVLDCPAKAIKLKLPLFMRFVPEPSELKEEQIMRRFTNR